MENVGLNNCENFFKIIFFPHEAAFINAKPGMAEG